MEPAPVQRIGHKLSPNVPKRDDLTQASKTRPQAANGMFGAHMQHKTSQILYAYWNEVRGSRLAPRRFDIEPSGIASILPETFILERLDTRRAPFRLTGTRICENFGEDLRGRNFLDLWRDGDRSDIEQDLATLADKGAVASITFEASRRNGDKVMFEATILPLLHLRQVVTRFIGSISAADAPYWLGTESLTIGAIVKREIIWPDGRPHPVIERLSHQSPFLPAMQGARVVRFERRQFRVLEGGGASSSPQLKR